MNVRYQDPVRGQFISEDLNFLFAGAADWVTSLAADPTYAGLSGFVNSSSVNYLANPQNLDPYSYVANNPLRHTDPTGKDYTDYNAAFTVPL